VLAGWLSVLPGAPKDLFSASWCSHTYHTRYQSTPEEVIRNPRYSESRPECPPGVWYSPQINASKFTLQIVSDSPGGFQWLKYILLIELVLVEVHLYHCTSSVSANTLLCHLGREGSHQFEFHKLLPSDFPLQPSPFYSQETQLPTSSSHLGVWHKVSSSGIMCAQFQSTKTVIWPCWWTFNATCISDCSSCIWLPRVAIVAEIIMT